MNDDELNAYIENLMQTYKGDLTLLADSLGALNLGKRYGWRVLRIIYSPMTYRKYQKALGLEFNAVVPEVTPLSERSVGYKIASKIKDYWAAVRREYGIDAKERVWTV
ncbi:hypothetical protein [Limnohabitans sp.]|jgi:hypothetical protein